MQERVIGDLDDGRKRAAYFVVVRPENIASRSRAPISDASSHSYGWSLARATSQPWTTSSSSAVRPTISAGPSPPAILVMPSHASGSCHAVANAARSRGMRVRQSSTSRDASPDGAWFVNSLSCFLAAASER
jgi:hypothetical protein